VGKIVAIELRYKRADDMSGWIYVISHDLPATYSKLKLRQGASYTFQARNVDDNGAVSDWVSAVVDATGTRKLLDAPTVVTTQAIADGIVVSWSVEGTVLVGVTFEVEHAPNLAGAPGTYSPVAIVPTFQVTDPITDGGAYWYRVRLIDGGGNVSPWTVTTAYTTAKTVGDPAKQTPGAVINPFFENGNTDWVKGTDWAIIEAPGSFTGSWYATKATTVASSSDLVNSGKTPVAAGQPVTARAYCRSVGATGNVQVGIKWYDNAGIELTGGNSPTLGSAYAAASLSNWGEVILRTTAPAGAALAQFMLRVSSHSSGTWQVDNAYLYLADQSSLSTADRNALDSMAAALDDSKLSSLEKASIVPAYKSMLRAYFGTSGSNGLAYTAGQYAAPHTIATTSYTSAITTLKATLEGYGLKFGTVNTVVWDSGPSTEVAWTADPTPTTVDGPALRAQYTSALLEESALRQSIADAERLTRLDLAGTITQVGGDGYLTPSERRTMRLIYQNTVSQGTVILTRIVTELDPKSIPCDHSAYDSALTALTTYLNGLSPDLRVDPATLTAPQQVANTPITDRAAWYNAWKAFLDGFTLLQTNFTKAAQDTANSAMDILSAIGSDNILSKGAEKQALIQIYRAAQKDYSAAYSIHQKLSPNQSWGVNLTTDTGPMCWHTPAGDATHWFYALTRMTSANPQTPVVGGSAYWYDLGVAIDNSVSGTPAGAYNLFNVAGADLVSYIGSTLGLSDPLVVWPAGTYVPGNEATWITYDTPIDGALLRQKFATFYSAQANFEASVDTIKTSIRAAQAKSGGLVLASASRLGSVRVGSGLTIDSNGILSALGGGGGGGDATTLGSKYPDVSATADTIAQRDLNGWLFAVDVSTSSDARLKYDVASIKGALDKVLAMRGVTFTRVGDTRKQMGVIAQEMEEVAPEVVHTDDEGMKSVTYGNLVGVLIEAVKEQQATIVQLIAQVDALTKN
jgi:hypothetical protein